MQSQGPQLPGCFVATNKCIENGERSYHSTHTVSCVGNIKTHREIFSNMDKYLQECARQGQQLPGCPAIAATNKCTKNGGAQKSRNMFSVSSYQRSHEVIFPQRRKNVSRNVFVQLVIASCAFAPSLFNPSSILWLIKNKFLPELPFELFQQKNLFL